MLFVYRTYIIFTQFKNPVPRGHDFKKFVEASLLSIITHSGCLVDAQEYGRGFPKTYTNFEQKSKFPSIGLWIPIFHNLNCLSSTKCNMTKSKLSKIDFVILEKFTMFINLLDERWRAIAKISRGYAADFCDCSSGDIKKKNPQKSCEKFTGKFLTLML